MFQPIKDSHFVFDRTLDKQIDGVAMDFHLAPTLANAFFNLPREKWS